MMNLFLPSRRKGLLIFISVCIIGLLIIQAGISLTLSASRTKISAYLSQTLGYPVSINGLSFNFLRGMHFKDVSVSCNRQSNPPVLINNLYISLDLWPVFTRRALLIQAIIDKAEFAVNKESEGINLQVILSDIVKRAPKPKIAIPVLFNTGFKVYLKEAKLTYTAASELSILIKKAVIRQELQKIYFHGLIEFNYHMPKNSNIRALLGVSDFQQKIKCSMQGSIQKDNLVIDQLWLSIGKDQLLGMGITKKFMERNPYVDINLKHVTLSVQNIGFLADILKADGYIFLSARFYGPMDDTRISLNASLQNCNFTYPLLNGGSCAINNLDALIGYNDRQLRLEKASLKLNSFPLNIKLLAIYPDRPDFTLIAGIPDKPLKQANSSLKECDAILEGRLEETIKGNLQLNASYLKEGALVKLGAYFKNIDFEYRNSPGKNFRAETMELKREEAQKIQRLEFTNVRARLSAERNRTQAKDIILNGYGSIITGGLILDTKKAASLIISLNGTGLNAQTLMQDINITDKILAGDMQVRLDFNNQIDDFLKGSCSIKNGRANLDILAGIAKLPSLNDTNFETLDALFSANKSRISIEKLTLSSQDVLVDSAWQTNGTVDGSLNLKISARLLNQSPHFSRLLSLTRIQEPFIDFDFMLGGTPQALRVMWLKGDFKDKIKARLPSFIRKSIENNVDQMIDEIYNK